MISNIYKHFSLQFSKLSLFLRSGIYIKVLVCHQENSKLSSLRRQHSEAALLRQRSCFNVLSTVGESGEGDHLVQVLLEDTPGAGGGSGTEKEGGAENEGGTEKDEGLEKEGGAEKCKAGDDKNDEDEGERMEADLEVARICSMKEDEEVGEVKMRTRNHSVTGVELEKGWPKRRPRLFLGRSRSAYIRPVTRLVGIFC